MSGPDFVRCKCGLWQGGMHRNLSCITVGGAVHSPVMCLEEGHPLFPMLRKLAGWEQSPTHEYAGTLRQGNAYGNRHRIRILEDVICLTCGKSRGTCEHPRIQPEVIEP